MPRDLTGACHCGTIRINLRLADETQSLMPRHCGCSFCRKHGGLYVSAPEGSLVVSIADGDGVSRYRFGHGTAEFLVCKRCGIFPAVLSEIDGRLHAVVNANTFDPPLALDDADVPTADYESETTAERLARRGQRWIGDVTVREGLGAAG